jgi:hypothetical protein
VTNLTAPEPATRDGSTPLPDGRSSPGEPLFGTGAGALARGMWHTHSRLLGRDRTNAARFAPDLLADPDVVRISRRFPARTAVSLLAPALLGGLIGHSARLIRLFGKLGWARDVRWPTPARLAHLIRSAEPAGPP